MTFSLVLLLALAGESTGPIDFEKVPRTIAELPELVAETPRYGLFLFGAQGDTRIWAVLDASRRGARAYDVLHLDLDADGDLTDEGERFEASSVADDGSKSHFDVGALGGQTGFQLTWTPKYVRVELKWGKERVRGGYAPTREQYAGFASSAADAPVYVLGSGLPFQFERWIDAEMPIGRSTDFKVFMGNRGSRSGTFMAVDQDFLPQDEFVLATLIYTDTNRKQRRHQVELRSRC